MKNTGRFRPDNLGIIVSGICTLHCVIMSLLYLALPAIPYFMESYTHLMMFSFALPLAAWSLFRSFRFHRSKLPVAVGSAGIVTLAVGMGIPGLSGMAEIAITIAGSAMLIYAHLRNLQLCQDLVGHRH